MLDTCGMIDLGFEGPAYTWCNKRGGVARIQERLDRAMANSEWRQQFPEATVSHLPRTYLDHCPLLIQCEASISMEYDVTKRPFSLGSRLCYVAFPPTAK